MNEDTIFALSSGAPPAAIAVVRISGPMAFSVVEAVAGDVPPSRSLALRNLRDPASGDLLDHGLVACFPASGSVSGEPLAELHLHGGRATIDAVLRMLGRQTGCRAAQPGEFTFRAFSNGKMDLIEVESLSELLRAETEGQRRAAIAQAGLSTEVERWRHGVLQVSAMVEAMLDQSDEDDVPSDRGQVDQLLRRLVDELEEGLAKPSAERLFDGVRVVFAGPPNCGKSSLINALAQREVAIVSPIAGTTRDVIEAPVVLGGIPFVFTDVAGLRDDTADVIEHEGVVRARARIQSADIIVWMGDGPAPACDASILPIGAKADLTLMASSDGRPRVSSLTGEGLHQLIERLVALASRLLPREGDIALTRRQRTSLRECGACLRQAREAEDLLIIAENLREARRGLDRLTGRAGMEEMLDALFSSFCVGK